MDVCSDGLRRCLAQLGTDAAGELVREARDLVWPRRAALLGRLQRLQTLGDGLRSRPWSRVLCHGDLIGENLLHGRSGRLWLVDWDAAALAPRELDISLFTAVASPGSSTATGSTAVAATSTRTGSRFSCCAATSTTSWTGCWPCCNQQPEAQRRADLDGVRWCLAFWEGLDERIRQTRSILARRH